jgi:hypothetical protein
MKILLVLFSSLFFFSSSFSSETAEYDVLPGKLHSGGHIKVEILQQEPSFVVKMNFIIYKRRWVPVPSHVLSGQNIMELPAEFRDERGYLELEQTGTMSLPKADLKYLGRVSFRNYENGHKVLIIPHNGKSKTEVIYHPELPGVGWGRVRTIFISSIPLLNGYQAIAEVNE